MDPKALRTTRRTNLTQPLKQVVIVGGTHGNESNGVYLVRHFQDNPKLVERESFTTSCVSANPYAIEKNLRYVDEDMNRCCLLKDIITESKRNTTEGRRALELNATLGPKQSPNPQADFIFDLHNTTANTGVALMLAPDDTFALSVAAYLQQVDSSVNVVNWADVDDWPLVPTLGRSGMTVEVGACPWGCIEPVYYQQTQRIMCAALDYIHAHNMALQNSNNPCRSFSVPIFRRVCTVHYPTEDGKLTAYIHPDRQSKDFVALSDGDPIFSTFGGETVVFDASKFCTQEVKQESSSLTPEQQGKLAGPELYPFFINEAAYYESRVAFVLGQRYDVEVTAWLLQ